MFTTLGLIAIFLVLVIIFQISKAAELVTELKGEEEAAERNNAFHSQMFLWTMIIGLGAVVWSAFYYGDMYLPEPSSEHGHWIRNMFFWTLVATVPVFLLCHILLFYFSYRYKSKKGQLATWFPHSTKLEMIWMIVPAIVMIVLVYEGLRNWNKITGPAPQEAMIIEATGQQFQWTIRYSGEDNKLGSKTVAKIGEKNPMGQNWEDKANLDDFTAGGEFRLPVNKPVMVKINSLDVLHSFYLPHFRVKMDAVPGIPTQFWFTPTKTTAQMREELGNPNFNYELACAELCGKAHFNMKMTLVVEEEEQYKEWAEAQTPVYEALKAAEVDTSEDKNEESKGVVSL